MADYSRDQAVTRIAGGQRNLVFHRDHEKDPVFRGAGFDVMRPTRAHVVYEGPRVLVLIAQALA